MLLETLKKKSYSNITYTFLKTCDSVLNQTGCQKKIIQNLQVGSKQM